jgi:hypothetical protein
MIGQSKSMVKYGIPIGKIKVSRGWRQEFYWTTSRSPGLGQDFDLILLFSFLF